MRRSVETYLSFLLLAVTCAVWIVYVRHSAHGLGQAPTSLAGRCRWWVFFVAKCVLIGSIHYFTPAPKRFASSFHEAMILAFVFRAL